VLSQPFRDVASAIGLRARHVGQVDVDLVDAAVLDDRCEFRDGCLEEPRVAAVLVEIGGQQDRVGRARPPS